MVRVKQLLFGVFFMVWAAPMVQAQSKGDSTGFELVSMMLQIEKAIKDGAGDQTTKGQFSIEIAKSFMRRMQLFTMNNRDFFISSERRLAESYLRNALYVVDNINEIYFADSGTEYFKRMASMAEGREQLNTSVNNRLFGFFSDYLTGEVLEVSTVNLQDPTDCRPPHHPLTKRLVVRLTNHHRTRTISSLTVKGYAYGLEPFARVQDSVLFRMRNLQTEASQGILKSNLRIPPCQTVYDTLYVTDHIIASAPGRLDLLYGQTYYMPFFPVQINYTDGKTMNFNTAAGEHEVKRFYDLNGVLRKLMTEPHRRKNAVPTPLISLNGSARL